MDLTEGHVLSLATPSLLAANDETCSSLLLRLGSRLSRALGQTGEPPQLCTYGPLQTAGHLTLRRSTPSSTTATHLAGRQWDSSRLLNGACERWGRYSLLPSPAASA